MAESITKILTTEDGKLFQTPSGLIIVIVTIDNEPYVLDSYVLPEYVNNTI